MPFRVAGILMALLSLALPAADLTPHFEGRKKCGSCHRSQLESWEKTTHASALEVLAPNARIEAKKKARLDPARDYRQDPACVGCHTTGYASTGGYDPKEPSAYLVGVGCESCHGPGSAYRLQHRKAGHAFERKREATPREILVETGQEFRFEERCAACHLNYEGSRWRGAKKPYTPFTPKLDPKYAFDFARAVRDDKAMHAHFRLEGVFIGPPTPPFHDEFQSRARPGVAGQEE